MREKLSLSSCPCLVLTLDDHYDSFGEAFKPETEEEMAALQLKELKNGRLAMVAR